MSERKTKNKQGEGFYLNPDGSKGDSELWWPILDNPEAQASDDAAYPALVQELFGDNPEALARALEGRNGGGSSSQGGGAPPKPFAGGGSVISPPRPQGMRLRPGLIKSGIPGRTDKIPARVPAGSYVIPADIVSGHGEGNTIAGGKALDRLFRTGPYNTDLGRGIREPRVNYGRPVALPKPRGPVKPIRPPKFADGGETDDDGIEIIVAGGEYLLPPEVAERLGGGDISHGHDILDQFVLQSRQKIVEETKKLKGPKK